MNLYSKRNVIVIVLLVYTWLNIRIVYPFLFGDTHVSLLKGVGVQNDGSSLLAIVLSVFLNAAVVLYFLRENIKNE